MFTYSQSTLTLFMFTDNDLVLHLRPTKEKFLETAKTNSYSHYLPLYRR